MLYRDSDSHQAIDEECDVERIDPDLDATLADALLAGIGWS